MTDHTQQDRAASIPDAATEAAASICGETTDHEQVVTYEDSGSIQWSCERCGAEGWEDKDG